MVWLWLILAVIGWLGAGFLAAGFEFAYWQREFPRVAAQGWRVSRIKALILGMLFGPIDLATVFCLSGFGKHGWLNPFGPGDKPKPKTLEDYADRIVFSGLGDPDVFPEMRMGTMAEKPPIPELQELVDGLEKIEAAPARERIEHFLKQHAAPAPQEPGPSPMLQLVASRMAQRRMMSPAMFGQSLSATAWSPSTITTMTGDPTFMYTNTGTDITTT